MSALAARLVAPSTHAHPPNPRRTPAERSVSLLHSPQKRKLSPNDRSDSSSEGIHQDKRFANISRLRDSPSSLKAQGRGSSSESSNAEKWFDQSNNEVHDNRANYPDHDPPFFMRNSSSNSTPPDAIPYQLAQQMAALDGSNSAQMRTGMRQLGDDGGSSEDFRSVIDDLTIANKKLKRRLKKYEKLHDSHLKDEKLFEVRIHGLPPDKKRELEETLRKFATSLGSRGQVEFPTNGYNGLMPLLQRKKTAESQTSMQHTDSAYASMSASGPGSSAQSGNDSRHIVKPASAATRQQNTQNIQSYLHQIPEGLLPQSNPAAMSERAKKKLVVRRLEQIFAGKGAASAGHQHQIQQEEVSQMAARADRSAMEAQGQRASQEGQREALIMSKEQDDIQAETSDDPTTGSQAPSKTGDESSSGTSANQRPLEQRPTRPLDLDPQRAQVPSENIQYMRRLGFSPLESDNGSGYEEGHGWIYLNFLHNMAQLHTINVTADFIIKALGEYSDRFEISEDGRKVRWIGRPSLTRASSSGGGSGNDRTRSDAQDRQSPRKRPRLVHRSSSNSNPQALRPGVKSTQRPLVYTPLFFHKSSSDDSDDSTTEGEDDTDESPFPVQLAGDSSGMTSSGVRTTGAKKKTKDDGPIIFYNNARFCTDLSGERKPQSNPNAPPYFKVSAHPIGAPRSQTQVPAEKRGPLAQASQLPEPMDLDDNPIPQSMELSFPPTTPMQSDDETEKTPLNLEVTGIGGVWPADNFAIQVESRHARVDQEVAPSVAADYIPRSLPPKFAGILHGADGKGRARAAVHKQVLSTNLQALPPSELPPALSFMPFDQESVYDDDSDADDDMSLPPNSVGFPPSAAPQVIDLPTGDSDDEDAEDSDNSSECESDSSFDLLAAARELDPDAIREKEREYDANLAERLAEEIPAGSSAATAGGGSGFASPASDAKGEAYRRAKAEFKASRPAALKRAMTGDSMAVMGDSTGSEYK